MLIVVGAKALRTPKLHSRVWRDATSAPWHEQGLSTFYSVLDSLLIFAGIHSGAGYGYANWLRWFGWTLLGNLVGGIGLTTLLQLVRSSQWLAEWRSR